MSDPIRVKLWQAAEEVVVIRLTRAPATELEESDVGLAIVAFVKALAVSESTDGPESPGLTQEQST